jgi:hypothetical protein
MKVTCAAVAVAQVQRTATRSAGSQEIVPQYCRGGVERVSRTKRPGRRDNCQGCQDRQDKAVKAWLWG